MLTHHHSCLHAPWSSPIILTYCREFALRFQRTLTLRVLRIDLCVLHTGMFLHVLPATVIFVHTNSDSHALIDVQNTARAEPVAPMIAPGGPRSVGIPPGGPLLAALEQLRARAPPVTPAPGDAPADRAIRRQPPGPPPLAGEQTPAAMASAAFPPPAPRRTRYQARLRGVPPQVPTQAHMLHARQQCIDCLLCLVKTLAMNALPLEKQPRVRSSLCKAGS